MSVQTATPRERTNAPRLDGAVPRRFASGDGLRAVAAMSVLVFHAGIAALLWRVGPTAVTGEGTASQFKPIFGFLAPEFVNLRGGLYIFFALSGYLLTRAFLASYLLGTPRPPIGRYFRNRALRIIPAFWVVATAYLIVDRPFSAGALGIAAVYGFAQNYYPTTAVALAGPGWTLDLEVAFYILIPIAAVIALAVKRRAPTTPRTRLLLTLGVLLVLYAVSLECKHLAGQPADLSYNIADYLFAFLPGVALAAIEPFAAPRVHETRAGPRWAWGLLAASVATLAIFIAIPAREEGLRLIFVTIGCGALVAAPLVLQWSTGRTWRVLDNRVIRWLGERSYGIYLIHLGLMTHVLARFGRGHSPKVTFLLLLAAVTTLTLIAADLLWRLVERPALNMRMPWRSAEFSDTLSPRADAPGRPG